VGKLLVLHREEDLEGFMSGSWWVASHKMRSREVILA
jgi:hypothetical protein